MKFSDLSLFAGGLLLAAAAQAQSPMAQSPVVLVSGPAGVVTALDVEASIQQYPFNERLARLARPEEVRRIAEEIYVRRALAKQSVQTGNDKVPLTQALVQVTRERVLSDTQIYELGKAGWPAEAVLLKAAEEKYQANPKRFEAPARTGARHILLAKGSGDSDRAAAREKAESIRKELVGGADFAALARRHSIDPVSASNGGDLGYFAKGGNSPEFESALEKLTTPGQLSEVVESQYGLHIIRLEGRKPAGVLPFAEVRGVLVEEIRAEADQRAKGKAIGDLRGEMKVQGDTIESLAKRFAAAKAD